MVTGRGRAPAGTAERLRRGRNSGRYLALYLTRDLVPGARRMSGGLAAVVAAAAGLALARTGWRGGRITGVAGPGPLRGGLRRVAGGAAEITGGALATAVGLLADAVLSYRPLTVEERQPARLVFGDAVDLDLVGVSAPGLDNRLVFAVQGLFRRGRRSRAFVTLTSVNYDVAQGLDAATLVHELTHVWQALTTGPFAMVEAVYAQLAPGQGYNYGYRDPANGDGPGAQAALRAAGGDLARFNREQQGQIARHYYVRRHVEGRRADAWEAWRPYVDAFRAAR